MSARTRPARSGFFGFCRQNLRVCGQAAFIVFCVVACAARVDFALAQTHAPDPLEADEDGLRVEGVRIYDPDLGALPPLVPPKGPDKLSFYSCLSADDKEMLAGTYKEVVRAFREFNEEWDRYAKVDKSLREAADRVSGNLTVKEEDNRRQNELVDAVKRERVSYDARRKDYEQAVGNYRTWAERVKAHCPAPAPAVTAGPPAISPPPPAKTTPPAPPAGTTPSPTPVAGKPAPAAVCPKCRHLADEIAELDTQIAKWERQTASLQKVADLKDPGIQDALKDIGKKLADLKARKTALQKEASACEKRCTVTEETKKTEHPVKKSTQKEKTKTTKKAGKRKDAKEEEAAAGPTAEQIGIAIGIGRAISRQHHRDRDDDKRRDDDSRGGSGIGLSGGGISFGR